jgi:hypothetical protein
MGRGTAAATGVGAIAPRHRAGRRAHAGAAIAALALAVLGALVAIDCLNLVGSTTWHDLSRTPHLNAVHRPREQPHAPTRRPPLPAAALAAPVDMTVPVLVVVVAFLVVPAWRSRWAPRVGRTRSPPRALLAGAPS